MKTYCCHQEKKKKDFFTDTRVGCVDHVVSCFYASLREIAQHLGPTLISHNIKTPTCWEPSHYKLRILLRNPGSRHRWGGRLTTCPDAPFRSNTAQHTTMILPPLLPTTTKPAQERHKEPDKELEMCTWPWDAPSTDVKLCFPGFHIQHPLIFIWKILQLIS